MSYIRFASVCDVPGCHQQSAEYEDYPTCMECSRQVCPKHQSPGTNDPESNTVLCTDCAAEALLAIERLPLKESV